MMAAPGAGGAAAAPEAVQTEFDVVMTAFGDKKLDVVKIVKNLRDQGMAIIVVSTEPETILSLADRILVMKKGEIVREFAEGTVSKDRLLEAA